MLEDQKRWGEAVRQVKSRTRRSSYYWYDVQGRCKSTDKRTRLGFKQVQMVDCGNLERRWDITIWIWRRWEGTGSINIKTSQGTVQGISRWKHCRILQKLMDTLITKEVLFPWKEGARCAEDFRWRGDIPWNKRWRSTRSPKCRLWKSWQWRWSRRTRRALYYWRWTMFKVYLFWCKVSDKE